MAAKDLILVGQMSEKHAKVLDAAKKSGMINQVYIVPVTNKYSLVDHLGFNKDDTNIDVLKTLIQKKYIIMKGKIHTEDFLKPVIELSKRLGGDRLIHCAVLKNKKTGKTFVLTDGACNLSLYTPDNIVIKAIGCATEVCVKCLEREDDWKKGVFTSLLSAGGETNPVTNPIAHEFWKNNQYRYPEGQLRIEQLDVAINEEIRASKGISGPTADVVVVSNINEGNAIWKSLTALGGEWICGGLLMGSKLPIILNSREDGVDSLQFSINLASLL